MMNGLVLAAIFIPVEKIKLMELSVVKRFQICVMNVRLSAGDLKHGAIMHGSKSEAGYCIKCLGH